MAWIKMRSELLTHPKIVRILSAMRPHDVQTKTDKFRVIGGLHAVWCIFDQHSEDGVLVGYTPELMDHMIGWEGFSQAMVSVDWLHFDGSQTLVLPEFDEHNSQSAKRRAEDQKRKEGGRKKDKCPQSVRNLSAVTPDESPTESGLEKEKEKEVTTSAASDKISLAADGWIGIPDDLLRQWDKAYPAVNIDGELAKAAAWVIANPKNRKSNYARFLTNWLTKAQDRAPRANGHSGHSSPGGIFG